MAVCSTLDLAKRIDALLKGERDPSEFGFATAGALIEFELQRIESRVRDLERRQRYGELE